MKQTTHDQVIEFYRSFLGSIGITEDENGYLMHRISNQVDPTPIQIKEKTNGENVDKPLVMPTKDNLRRMSDDGLAGFNPLCESTVRGESEVFRRLKRFITFEINQKILVIMRTVATISMSDETMKSLKSNQVEFVAQSVGDATLKDGFVTKLNKSYASAASEKSQTLPVSIYIRRDAKQEGSVEPFKRAAIVAFPYAVEASKAPATLGGVTFAKYEVKSIYNMLESILPGLTDRDSYSYYGNPSTVPNFTVLAHAWYGIATALNRALTILEGFDVDCVPIDLTWYTKLNKLPSWAGVIPSLDSNVGDGEEDVAERIAASRPKLPVANSPAARPRRSAAVEEEAAVVETARESNVGVRQKVGSARQQEAPARRTSHYDDRDYDDRRRRPSRNDERPEYRSRYDDRPRYEQRDEYLDDGKDNGNDMLRELRGMTGREQRNRQDDRDFDRYGARDGGRRSRYDDRSRRPSRYDEQRRRPSYYDDYDDRDYGRPRYPRDDRGGI